MSPQTIEQGSADTIIYPQRFITVGEDDVLINVIESVTELPKEEAKEKIQALLSKEPGLDSYDLAEKLNMDIRYVWKLTDELLAEKKIRDAES